YATAKEGVAASYNEGFTAELVVTSIVETQNDGVNDGDAVIFYHFRPDRAAQFSDIFANRASEGSKVEHVKDLLYETFTKYHDLSLIQ
ncbi:2,3-bisphosphoglycerate-independent phosphoglycerate mutase, partial [Staphylococcus aureus]